MGLVNQTLEDDELFLVAIEDLQLDPPELRKPGSTSMLVEPSVLLQEHFDFHYAKFIFLATFNQISIKILLHMISEYIHWLYFHWLLCPLFCPMPCVIT